MAKVEVNYSLQLTLDNTPSREGVLSNVNWNCFVSSDKTRRKRTCLRREAKCMEL